MTMNSNYIDDDGLVIFDSSTGLFSGVELTTKGDNLTKSATDYVRQAVGTDTYTLSSDSTASTGLAYKDVTPGSSVILLETQTASSSATIEFTSSFDDSTYLYYIFTLSNVRPQTDNVEFSARVSVNGGTSWYSTGYRWVKKWLSSTSGSEGLTANTSDSRVRVLENVGNAAGEGTSGRFFYIPTSSPGSVNASALIFDTNNCAGTGLVYRGIGTGRRAGSSTINGLQFYFSSGNVETGVFKMYGVEKS